MKAIFSILLLAALWQQVIYSMTCNDIPNEAKCNHLSAYGCGWGPSGCSGFLGTICTSCYFVDPVAGSTLATTTGTVSDPFQIISDANAKITSALTGTIYILNHRDTTSVHLAAVGATAGVTVVGTVTILPLFPGEYALDYSRFSAAFSVFPPPQIAALRVSANKYLYLKGAVITYTMPVGATMYMFDTLAGGNLTLEAVSFVNCVASSNGAAIRVQGTLTTNLTVIGGRFENSNLKISLGKGNAYFKGVDFTNLPTLAALIIAPGTVIDMDSINFSGVVNVLMFQLTANAIVRIKDSTFENSNFTLATTVNNRAFEIRNTVFKNIFVIGDQFLQLNGVSTTDSLGISVMEDTTFENIQVPQTIFLLQRGSAQLTMNYVTMSNITKYARGATADLQMEAQWPGGVCGLSSLDVILTVQNSKFINISSHCFGLQQTTVSFTNNEFDNTALATAATTKEFTSTSVGALSDNSGASWININQIRLVDASMYRVTLQGNTFKTNAFPSLYGGAIRFRGTSPASLYVVSNNFTGNVAAYGGAIYTDDAFLGFDFSGNRFENNIAYDGGAIYKASTSGTDKTYSPSVKLSGDKFLFNKATRNGGAIYLDYESLSITNVEFDHNQAANGGGIYYLSLDNANNQLYGQLSNGRFTNNYASNIGGAMKLFFQNSSLNENPSAKTYFSNNTDSHAGPQVSTGKPSYYMINFYDVLVEKTFSELDNLQSWTQNASRTKLSWSWNSSADGELLIQQKSGHEVKQIYEVAVYDDQHQFVNYIVNERVIAQITSTSDSSSNFDAYLVASPVYLSFTDGAVYIKTALKMVGEPLSNAVLNFRGVDSGSNMLKAVNLLMNINFQISFTDCETGDIYDNTTKTCDTCAEGTYTLDNPYDSNTICYQCDTTEQLCLGGSKISPQPGYWRYDTSLAVVLPCPESSACLGGLVDEIYYPQGKCEFPYEGNLCNSCAQNYAKFGSDESCTNCRKNGGYYIKFLAFFALRIGAMVYSIKMNLDKVSGSKKKLQRQKTTGVTEEKESSRISSKEFQSNLMKIVVNFLQVSTIIFQYKFDWPDFIQRVLDVTNKFVPINSDGFSIDCIVAVASQDNSSVYFIKLVVTLLEPFALWLGLVGGYVLYLKHWKKETVKGNEKIRKNIVVLFVITAFIIQPSLIQSTLELFKCTNLRTPDDTAYFMAKEANVECWTSKHIIWSVGIAFPFFLLWGVILPLILFKKLRAQRNALNNSEVMQKYAFVYDGLKAKRYYWEFVTLIRKTSIIIVFVFFNVISVQAQAFATFLIILTFTSLQIKLRPYANRTLNKLELFSLVTLLVMAYSGMFFLSGGTTEGLTILLIIISMVFNLTFYAVIGLYFLKSYRIMAKKLARSVTKKVKSTIERSRSSSSNSSSDERSKRSNEVKDIEDIIAEIDSPKKEDNDHAKGSRSNISDIPMETDEDSPSTDKRVVYNNAGSRDESLSQSSIVRNFGFKQSSFAKINSNSMSQNLGMNNSVNNSMVGLLGSPLGSPLSSAQSSSRRPHNLHLNINQDNLLRPKAFDSKRSGSEFLDSPLALRNLGFAYEDSPRLSSARPRNYNDESLMLKIPSYTPSELRSSREDVEDSTRKNGNE